MMLREYGYRVLQASTPEEALALMHKSAYPVDLLVTDVIMPGMDGTEVFQRLSAASPGLKVLYMSGYPEDVISTHGVLRSGINFIQKPFSPASLVKKVRLVLAQAEQTGGGAGQDGQQAG
jgi:DNA-binding response OmpR family regulator